MQNQTNAKITMQKVTTRKVIFIVMSYGINKVISERKNQYTFQFELFLASHPAESSENTCYVRKYCPSFIMGVYEKILL